MIKKILLTVYFILFSNFVFAESMKMIGMKGKSSEVSRTINVKMYDNYFEPKSIKVKSGETIKFVVENKGKLVHEYNIATKKNAFKASTRNDDDDADGNITSYQAGYEKNERSFKDKPFHVSFSLK
ncbi:copper-binding protein [Candidatus Pelagibacter sp. IMCC9063]|uniref:cupredoxin domain-containing protein n=1 Tax=Pelagibacter sp. (strain IMCC9063) TaxID=1002672 RepID=UPI0002046432|nr:cupredoxin domain-containing protein [Candidatus Pelagibacter sp. IMCC9063]AEA81784.1 copper-binding protein [Candidatus Pelagibacter sp. IMCC9063]